MLMIQANQTKSLDGDIMCFIDMYRYKIYKYQILYMLKMMKEYVSDVSNQIP